MDGGMSSEHATAASTAVSNNELKEMAYLILEDCRVEVISEVGDFQPHLKLPLRQWIQVSQLGNSTVLENQDCRTKCRKFVGTTENQLPFDGTCCCRRCNLVLLHQSTAKESLMLQLDWEQVPPFRGTISDVFPVTKGPPFASLSCSCPVAAAKAQRSDAALMAGLLVACREQITVIHCSVLFREDNQASLLWTLAFPHLQRQTTVANTTTRRSILFQQQPSVGLKTKIRSRIVYKPLDPALQLLLSLVRSDWDQLEVYQQRLTHREVVGDALPPRTKKPSFFPPKLTLGELYHRTQSSSSTNSMHHHRNGTRSRNKKVTQNDACLLISLPLEVLVEKMSPFLNAQSLAGLITSCIYLNRSLQGVVPGLKLRLYSHQITSLSWMRRREASLLRAETDCLKIKQPFQNCDVHRSITGGATVRLASKPNESYECNVRLDTYTGREIAPDPEFCNNESLPRRLAHGGLLCDDPGLGKTVTVLALILQTCGLSTASETKPSSTLSTTRSATLRKDSQSLHVSTELNNNSENDAIFRAYWAEHVVAEFRGPALLKLVNELGKKNRGGGSFPLEEVQQAITDDKYGANFSAFELGVEDSVRQYSPDDELQSNATKLMEIFKSLLREFKETQMRSARKSFSNAKSKPNSRVAALIEEEARQRLLDSLIPSAGTLLVIPPVLMEHWQTQIKLHVDLRYCTNKKPLVFVYENKVSTMTVEEATVLCQRGTYAPVVFLDKAGTRPLPPAKFLSMFQIVITTTHRFMNEWKKGSFQEELERHNSDDIPIYSFAIGDYKPYSAREACELLKVHWLRMVVDEGHSMGNDKANATIQFAAWVNAQRRWAMTGTPTKQNAAQLGQLRGLMRFLQHDFFTSRLEGDKVWKRNIVRCWRDGDLVSFFRLSSLLGFLMKRHTKSDIAELPPPAFLKTEVSMSYVEATTYNTLVCAVQANLLLTSMNGKTSGFQDSLLHRSQSKNARLVLHNIRRVCTGWSRVIPTLPDRWFRETICMAGQFNLSDDAITEIREFLYRAENEQLSECLFCGVQVSTLLLMPCCGGQICTECMDSSTTSCYLCDDAFDVDDLQKFQPGFVLDWRSNLELKRTKILAQANPGSTGPQLSRVENTRPKNGEGEGDIVEGPIIRPHHERQRKKKLGDGHECEYDRFAANGRCVHCFEEHSFCNLLNISSRCELCHRVAEECSAEESKSFHLTNRLLELCKSQPRSICSDELSVHLDGEASRPLKVIVFSQFRASLNFVGDRLLRRFGTACIAEYFGKHRKEELNKFTSVPSCFCLLLTKDGAEGLDLSFVTNIVFFEEIYDKSLQDQAVARAWRMGARGQVEVETLIASKSVEETMGEQMHTEIYDDETSSMASCGDQQRLKSLLQSLRINTDYHHFSSQQDEWTGDGDNIKKMPASGSKRPLPSSALQQPVPLAKKATKVVKFSVLEEG